LCSSSYSRAYKAIEEEDDNAIVIFFITKKKKKGGEVSLLSSSHFYHHLEAPLVGALLKLRALDAPMDIALLKH
jgi:hypothetical protein